MCSLKNPADPRHDVDTVIRSCDKEEKAISTDYDDLEEVYAPAEDTYLLLKTALKEVKAADDVIEIGCGRGIISAELSHHSRTVVATDINPHAVRVAQKDGVEAIRADIFRGIRAKFDLVVFNPPYLPTADDERLEGWLNKAFDGGRSGRDTVDRFLEGLADHLKPDGRALLLVSTQTGLEEVEEKAGCEGFEVELVASERYFFEVLHVLRLTASETG